VLREECDILRPGPVFFVRLVTAAEVFFDL
jgi:hypothetical protein